MTITTAEHEFIRALPKRRAMCPHQQKEQDRKLKLAFVEAFRDEDSVRDIAHMAAVAMRVVKECRG